MPQSSSPKSGKSTLPGAVEWRLALARGVMLWERVWPLLWPPMALVTGFLILSFLDVWQALPRNLLALVIFALVFAAGFLMWRNLSKTKVPDRAEGLRRLEDDSGLDHRPLSSFADTPVGMSADRATRDLWRAHRARLADKVKQISFITPRNETSRKDPYAFRLLLILAFLVSLLVAGSEWDDRLRRSLSPFLGPLLEDDARIDAWVEPPAYTGLPAITLLSEAPADPDGERALAPVTVPEGSTLHLRMSGFPARPDLTVTPERPKAGFSADASVRRADGSMEGFARIGEPVTARLIYRGRTLRSFTLGIDPDQPPTITLSGAPEPTAAASFRINYTHTDDYGLTSAKAIVNLIPQTEDDIFALAAKTEGTEDAPALWPNAGTPHIINLPTPKGGPGLLEDSALENLASHPWAGQEVLIQLEAEDGAGQKAFSEGIKFQLPQRIFLDPMARSVIELRKALADAPGDPRFVAVGLNALTIAPERFIPDKIAYLALRSAYWRLTHSARPETVREVYDMLWETALRLEDGNLSQTRDRLRQIQKRLTEALNRNAPASEIRQLMAQLKEAIGQYMAELMQQADQGTAMPQTTDTVEAQDLSALMQSIEQMASVGEHEQARQMLAELSQILDSLRPASGNQANGGTGQGQRPPSPQEQALSGALDDLGDIIGEQRSLMDETNRNIDVLTQGDIEAQNLQGLIERSFGFGNLPSNPTKRQLGPPENIRPSPDGESGSPAEDLANRIQRLQQDNFNNLFRNFGTRNPLKRERTPEGKPVDPEIARALAERQEALQEKLGDAVRRLGGSGVQIPENFGSASDAMDGSQMSLDRRDLQSSVEDQQAALDALRQGAEQLAEDLLQRQGKAGRQQQAAGRRDPLGRPEGGDGAGLGDSGRVSVPLESEFRKAREVLEELRKRSGERSRPKIELDYYDRLLKQF